MNIGDEILPAEIPRDTTYQDMDIQPQASSIAVVFPLLLHYLNFVYVSYWLENIGGEQRRNNIAIEFISIPLERTDGIEMSFCGGLMMKYVVCTICIGAYKMDHISAWVY